MDVPTVAAKRKRSVTGIRPSDDHNDHDAAAAVDEVSDAEVEEFYAILRRMRDASRRLCSGTGTGAGAAPTRAPAWCPSFSWEDFEPAPAPAPPAPAATPAPRLPCERVAAAARRQLGRLDLNAEPEPEAPEVAPATPRSDKRATA